MSSLKLLYLGPDRDLSLLTPTQPETHLETLSSAEALLTQLQTENDALILIDSSCPELESLLDQLAGHSVLVLAASPYQPWLYERFRRREILDLIDPDQLPHSLEKALIVNQDHLPGPGPLALPTLMSLKNEALALLYHQLQGPVTALEGYLEILQSDELPPSNVQQILNQLQQCVTRLRHYFYSLHLFSLVTDTPYRLKPRPFLFHQLLREFRRDLEQITILNAFNWDSQLDAQQDSVFADPYFMLNTLAVLFDLARRTAEPRGCQVSLQTSVIAASRLEARSQMSLEPSQYLCSFLPAQGPANYFQVTLQVRGVSASLNQALRFALGDPQVQRPSEVECVLGAYLAQRILQAHQSWLYLENQPGFGLLFSFVLPLHEPQAD